MSRHTAYVSGPAQGRAPQRIGPAEDDNERWFVRASTIEVPSPDKRWLVESLVGIEAVGVVGGDPKLGKSWLVSHIAVAVASGESCLGEFIVYDTGPVLLASAEGPAWMATDRLRHVCGHVGTDLGGLPIEVMSRHVPQLDEPRDQARLLREVERRKAKLLILDPLVQMHAGDENSAKGMVPVLNFINTVRRTTGAAVLAVHHTRKGAKGRGGTRLRGSSALHAWLDSGLYMRERGNDAELTSEQRCGPSPDPLVLRLVTTTPHHHLEIVDPEGQAQKDEDEAEHLKARILDLLADTQGPMPREQLRAALRVRSERLTQPILELLSEGRVQRVPGGIELLET